MLTTTKNGHNNCNNDPGSQTIKCFIFSTYQLLLPYNICNFYGSIPEATGEYPFTSKGPQAQKEWLLVSRSEDAYEPGLWSYRKAQMTNKNLQSLHFIEVRETLTFTTNKTEFPPSNW